MDIKQVRAYYKTNVAPQRAEMELKKQLVMPILDNLMNHITAKDARFCNTRNSTGPYYQGNFLWTKTCDEFDYHVNLSGLGKWDWITGKPRFYNLEQAIMYYLQDLDNIMANLIRTAVPLPKPPPGHSFSQLGTHSTKYGDLMCQEDIVPLLVRRKFKELLIEAVRALGYRGNIRLARKQDGPVLTLRIPYGTNGEVRVNMIPVIPMHISFRDHIVWPRDDARRLSKEKVAKIKEIGINAAATTIYYWSDMYEECEKELLVDMDVDGGCRKKVFRILENLCWEIERDRDAKTVLTSKHVKNVLLWDCEKFPNTDQWVESKLAERLAGMLEALKRQLQKGEMPHYWNPKVNLLDSVDKKSMSDVLHKITSLSRNPGTFLT